MTDSKKIKIVVTIPIEAKKALQYAAKKDDRSLAAFSGRILEAWIEAYKQTFERLPGGLMVSSADPHDIKPFNAIQPNTLSNLTE